MNRYLAWPLVMMLLLPTSLQASDLRERLHDLGVRACLQVLALGPLDGRDYAAEIGSAGLERDAYCGCVGEFFEPQTDGPGEEDPEVFMTRLVKNAMNICLEGDSHDDDVMDGDLEIEDFAFDQGDVDMCEMAMQGNYPMPGFDTDAVSAQLARTGQQRDDLCICAARYFTAGGEPLQRELENAGNPTVVYGSTMAGAINTCLLD